MGLTEEERFRFDLTGFLIRPAILTPGGDCRDSRSDIPYPARCGIIASKTPRCAERPVECTHRSPKGHWRAARNYRPRYSA